MAEPQNLLILLSDQHHARWMGCAGNPVVATPHLDALAARGTRFTDAVTNCPICVPVRASIATGRYVHDHRFWDNGHPYDGSVPSWHLRVREAGHRVDSIGKLHFRSAEDDFGFTECVEPLNVVEGIGDVLSCLRQGEPFRNKRPGIREAGPGESTYLQYDIDNADRAIAWLEEHGREEKPWVLFASFVCPHPPYIAPPGDFARYAAEDLPMPPQWSEGDWPKHPAMEHFRRFFSFDRPFAREEIRRVIQAYSGVCTFLDRQIGRVLTALEAHGLRDSTRVIYTSDHGEALGARGIFGKFTMYEESVGIPMIAAGPGVPAGATCATPVSLIDLYPTVLAGLGMEPGEREADLPGESLWSLAKAADRDRLVFSEYHAIGSLHGSFMLRDRRWKYIHHVAAPAQLFDLETDPEERHDLAGEAAQSSRMARFAVALRRIVDPEEADAAAKASQAAKIAAYGGREAALQRGGFANSPVPGEKPAFRLSGPSNE